ncbi:MAG: Holliday junction branch migration protein RuvA [Termitinemataceae bacterium]|nr:MAG: Holliday junction branch migration protein RuvA [Termitinemataceae bacterium]
MFNSISGEITAKAPGSICIETGGIEWEILMPAKDIGALGEPLSRAKVWVWLCHREDSMTLYGFSSERRRATFFELLKVEGIGPKAALKILGGISQAELERALEAGDVARLEAVPGLGKKTAQKMVLTLKGKLVFGKENGTALASPWGELADALTGMGYEKRAALAALERAAQDAGVSPGSPEAETLVFRNAILLLSGAV